MCVQAGAEFCDVLRPPAKRLCGKCSDTKKRGEEKKKKKKLTHRCVTPGEGVEGGDARGK